MYRLLEVGEVIENGDEYYGIEDKWLGFPPTCVGMKTVPHDAPIRRLVKPAVKPAASSVPDSGEGWRLLSEGETIIEGDQLSIVSERLSWSNVVSSIGQRITPEFTHNGRYAWRRRVAPVVSVGDRVKVLSGPWRVALAWLSGLKPMSSCRTGES